MRIPGPVYGAQIPAHCPGSIPKIDAFILELMQLSAGAVAGSECQMNDTLHVTGGGGSCKWDGSTGHKCSVWGWLIEATVQFDWGWVFLCWAGTTTNTDSLFCCQAYNTIYIPPNYSPSYPRQVSPMRNGRGAFAMHSKLRLQAFLANFSRYSTFHSFSCVFPSIR